MRLHSLELSGFKSFAKKTALEFSTPIVAIVGPNGSGKSNIAEAFRFVLGEQSIKSLRGKRGEDLIFNGSRTMARANRASIKLRLNNSDRLFNLDFDDVIIERIVHRDGMNEYLLNSSRVRLKDVLQLLASANVGASGHHIIAQGEADRILNAGSKERRGMIEEALGLKIFQYKKEESQKKLTKTKENIVSVQSLRREIEPHLRFLKKQVAKIELAGVLREELSTLAQEYFARESLYLRENERRFKEERKAPRGDLAELDGALVEAKEVIAKTRRGEEKTEVLLRVEQKLRDIRAERDRLIRDIGRLEGAMNALSGILSRTQETPMAPPGKTVPVEELARVVEEIERSVQAVEINEAASYLRETLRDIATRLRRFLNEQRGESDTVAVDSTGSVAREQEALRTRKERFEKEIQALEEQEEELLREHALLRSESDKEKDACRDAEKAVFEIMARKEKVSAVLARLSGEEERLSRQEADYKRELGEIGVLVGRAALGFGSPPQGGGGVAMSVEEVMHEERTLQEERRRALERLKIRLEEAGGVAGEDVLKEYEEAKNRDAFLEREIADLEHSAASLTSLINDLDKRLGAQFKEGVDKINIQFQEFFALMFGGGHAALALVKEERRRRSLSGALADDASGNSDGDAEGDEELQEPQEGIAIDVNLPHKRIKGLEALSGGERALTSIALLFAISQVNPPPFIVLDETDAAFDEANSKKYGDMIALLGKRSQLIVITHNRETMGRAGILYGVTMGSDAVSQLLSVKFDEAVAVAK